LFKFFNLFENLLVIRHSFHNQLYGSLFIDQESDSAAGIEFNKFSIRIGNQWECEIKFFGKFVVTVQTVFTYTQNLGVEPFKGLDILSKSGAFPWTSTEAASEGKRNAASAITIK
jgi:hypothetical protein